MIEPKYDEDVVNLGYLKRALGLTDDEAQDISKYISRHYAIKPQPPYYAGDTWIDGEIIYTCIKDRLIGTYEDSDWVTESGAKKEAEEKNRVFLRQPSNYSNGDMWILQSNSDHPAGKRGEVLISTETRAIYDADDWVNMLTYGTIRSINEVANNIDDALLRMKLNKTNGVVTIYYANSIPANAIDGDLLYVTESFSTYSRGDVYKYNGITWTAVQDKLSIIAFAEAEEARLISDGKIQAFYSTQEPSNAGIGDIWNNTTTKELFRYNGTDWIAVYNQNVNEVRESVDELDQNKVEYNDLTTPGQAPINADNIVAGTIDANQVNVINIDADNINAGTINGNNVNITNLNASNIKSGAIEIEGTYGQSNPFLKIRNPNSTSLAPILTMLWEMGISVCDYRTSNSEALIRTENPDGYAELRNDEVNAFRFNTISLAEKKKDFELLKSGLDIIKDIDIYKYRFKKEKDTKKHIGLVIGDNFRYSKEVTSKTNKEVELYSLISVCCRAIQEIQEEIEKLKGGKV